MANALLGIPHEYTILSTVGGSTTYPSSNLLNDEPGLIFQSLASTASNIKLDLGSSKITGAFSILGQNRAAGKGPSAQVRFVSYNNTTDQNADTNRVHDSGLLTPFSTNRSAELAKFLYVPSSPVTARYWTVFFDSYTYFEAWRLLLMETTQPATNIEVGASVLIDDRSERRYTRSGRRVIDPTVICPAFQGSWPWLTVTEMHAVRKMMFQRGGSYPVMFCLDPADTSYGEDHLFYGDLEKSLKIDLDNDDLNAFSISIVSIAP